MSLIKRGSLLLLLCAACRPGALSPADGGHDLAGSSNDGSSGGSDGSGGRDTSGGDGDGGSADLAGCATRSPSGYECDSWSTHLYLASWLKRQGSTLQVLLEHNPDNEGPVDAQMAPPEHNYYQLLTVSITLTPEVRRYLCVAFTPLPTPASFDAGSATFLSDVDYSSHTLLFTDQGGAANLPNLIDICGGSTVQAIYAPALTPHGRPALADVALAIPLAPPPTGFTVGTTFHGWLARGILFVDEESELAPEVTATVVAVQ